MNKFLLGLIVGAVIAVWPTWALSNPPTPSCPIKEVTSTKDCRSAECNVACQWAGYDVGSAKGNDCYCADIKPLERMRGKRTKLPSRGIDYRSFPI